MYIVCFAATTLQSFYVAANKFTFLELILERGNKKVVDDGLLCVTTSKIESVKQFSLLQHLAPISCDHFDFNYCVLAGKQHVV